MKYPKAYVLYANENYIDIVNACAKSIKTFSNLPVFVYLLNCDKAVLEADKTINWECDIDADETEEMYLKQSDLNFYVNRASKRIYRLIKERPLIVKHALKMASLVCYVDCDSIATKHIDRAFSLFNEHSFYPFFSEGIYDSILGFNTKDHSSENNKLILDWSYKIYNNSINTNSKLLVDNNNNTHDGLELKLKSENSKFKLISNIFYFYMIINL